jgi:predicted solute-binding protein
MTIEAHKVQHASDHFYLFPVDCSDARITNIKSVMSNVRFTENISLSGLRIAVNHNSILSNHLLFFLRNRDIVSTQKKYD